MIMSSSSWGEKFIELAKLAHKQSWTRNSFSAFFWSMYSILIFFGMMLLNLALFLRGDFALSQLIAKSILYCMVFSWIDTALLMSMLILWLALLDFTLRFLWLCYKYDGSTWPIFRDLEQHEEERIANLKEAGKQYRKRRDKEESKSKKKLEKQIERIRSIGCQQTDPTD